MYNRQHWKLKIILILLAIAGSAGCSIRRMAIAKVGDALASSGAVFASEDDPELVRDAAPFSLKLMESVLSETPGHRGLLLAAARGFTQYAYAFVQQEAEENQDLAPELSEKSRDRARRLLLRARDYGMRGLECRYRGLGRNLAEDPARAVAGITAKSDVPLLYWTAVPWAAAVAVSLSPELIADLPLVEALIDRALVLDESFETGAIHGFLISYEMSRQGAKDPAGVRARKHFDRSIALTGGLLASPYLALAESVAQPAQDRRQFEELLQRALELDPGARPEWRLENHVMQRRAQWLLKRIDRLFVEGAAHE